ncbi:MAG: hypothetical protein ABI570_06575 [Ilumatobacteraceae bacterium]
MKFFRLIFVEMRRALHRRLVRWMIFIALVGCAGVGLIAFLTSRNPVKFAHDTGHPARMVNWWVSRNGGESFLTPAALFLVVGAVICGASVVGAEWKSGTMTTMLTWVPSRLRLHGARTISAAVLSFVISFLLQIVYLASALPAVITHGTTTGTNASWWSALLLAMLRISFITLLVTVLAVSIATIGRNTSAALVALATWALVIERLIAGFWPKYARFMIAENVGIVVPWEQLRDASFDRPPIIALIALIGYLIPIVAVATVLFVRRDVATT